MHRNQVERRWIWLAMDRSEAATRGLSPPAEATTADVLRNRNRDTGRQTNNSSGPPKLAKHRRRTGVVLPPANRNWMTMRLRGSGGGGERIQRLVTTESRYQLVAGSNGLHPNLSGNHWYSVPRDQRSSSIGHLTPLHWHPPTTHVLSQREIDDKW